MVWSHRIMLISEKEQLLKELKSLRSCKDKTTSEKHDIRERIARLEQEIKGTSRERSISTFPITFSSWLWLSAKISSCELSADVEIRELISESSFLVVKGPALGVCGPRLSNTPQCPEATRWLRYSCHPGLLFHLDCVDIWQRRELRDIVSSRTDLNKTTKRRE